MEANVIIRLMKLFEELIHDSLFELETSDEEFKTYENAVRLIRDKCNWELSPDSDSIAFQIKAKFHEAVDNSQHLTKQDKAEIILEIMKLNR